MATERHVTLIEADVSQYLAAKARQRAADDAHAAAAKQLAAVLTDTERERIAAMANSASAARQAAAAQRERVSDARKAVAITRQEQDAIRQTINLHRQEQDAIRRVAREREDGFRRAEAAAAKYGAELRKQQDMQSRGMGAMAMGGMAGAAVVGGVAAIREAITLTNELADQSMAAQSVARNLQLDIRGARAATGGLVADYDLALAANKAYAMDVADTGAEFAHIVSMVSQQATKLGKDQTQLVNDAIEAIGKQEAEIFDNLGAGALRLTDAYEIYAESIGKAANELTAAEKAEAFNAAAIIQLEKATGQATITVDGFARSWKELGTEYTNAKNELFGFDDQAGRVNEALRELTDEQLDRLRFAEALSDEDAKRMDAMGSTAREMQGYVEEWGIGIMDLKEHADRQGVSYLQMLENAKTAHAELAAEQEKQRIESEKLAEVADLTAQAEETDHIIALMQVEGASAKQILDMQIASLETQREAAVIQAELTKSVDDQNKVTALGRAIELAEAKKAAPARGGRRRDPNEALDRETEATLRLLDARQKIYAAEHANERDLETAAAQRFYLIELQREELEVREAAANARKVRGPAEEAKLEAERLEIATERRLLDIEAGTLAHEEARRQAEERIAAMDREIELLDAQGVAVGLLERRRTDAHLAMVAEFGSAEELRDAEHERDLVRIEDERAVAARRAQDKLDAFTRESELDQARGVEIYDLASQRLALEAQVAAAEGDHAQQRQLLHQAEVARIEERRAKMQRATQATNSMLTQGMGLFSAITEATIKDEAKRERASLRARGVEAVARGALETVEAVAAFASFNYVQGALHIAAAATAFATGIPMIAGKVPSKADATAGAGTGKDHQTVISQPDSGTGGGSSAASGSPSTPPSAEALIDMRQRQTGVTGMTKPAAEGGTVIQIGTLVTGDSGTVLKHYADQQLKKRGSR